MTKDYSIMMQDSAGRTCTLFINGDEVAEAVQQGLTPMQARLESQDNQFANAISRGEIGADAWIVYRFNSKRVDALYEDSKKIKSSANRNAVQAIINSGEVNAADTIRDEKDRTQDDYEWLAIATIGGCLSTGEYNRYVVEFFTKRGVSY